MSEASGLSEDLKGLSQELANILKQSPDDNTELVERVDQLIKDVIKTKLDLIATLEATPEIKILISDIIKFPDRVTNLVHASPSQSSVPRPPIPDDLIPANFCDKMMLFLCETILRKGENMNGETVGFFISKLVSNYRSYCPPVFSKFWRFLAALIQENPAKSHKVKKIFETTDVRTAEFCLLSALSSLPGNPVLINKVLGNAVKDGARFKIVENNIFLRGLSSSEELIDLVVICSLMEGDHVNRILRRAFLLVADPVFIEFTKFSEQVDICQCICICLSLLTEAQLNQARVHFTPILLKSAMHWMEHTTEKRNLGMSLILTVLKKFGEDKLPGWEVQDKELFKDLQDLANYIPVNKKLHESSKDVLSKWHENAADPPTKNGGKQSKSKPPEAKIEQKIVPKMKEPEEDLDSDDDDFPAYDMSHDTKVDMNKKDKKILYLREVIEELGNPDSDMIEDCFGILPDLCRRHLQHEDSNLVSKLTKAMLYSENRLGSKDWVMLREQAMLAVICTQPLPAAKSLVPTFYDNNFPMDTRFGILSWLVKAGEQIQMKYSGKPEFADYIKTCVRGLCGGAGWAKLEFTGLDSHYVNQLLISVGSLLRTGKNLPGWPELASEYLDLVLFTARSGRAVIQECCVHSISLVLSLTEPHMIYTMEDVLARVSQWLGHLQGSAPNLQEEGAKALMLLVMLQQEFNKLVMEEQLQPQRTISFKTNMNTERIK